MSDLVSLTVQRLDGTSPLKKVEGLLQLQSLVQPPLANMPCAFVMPNTKKFSPNGRLNALSQTGPQTVRILLMIPTNKPQAKTAFDPVQPVEDAVMSQLLNWQPESEHGPVQILSAQLIDLAPTYLTYEMIFWRLFTVTA